MATTPSQTVGPFFTIELAHGESNVLVARFDYAATEPEWALGYEWDIVLRRTPMEDG